MTGVHFRLALPLPTPPAVTCTWLGPQPCSTARCIQLCADLSNTSLPCLALNPHPLDPQHQLLHLTQLRRQLHSASERLAAALTARAARRAQAQEAGAAAGAVRQETVPELQRLEAELEAKRRQLEEVVARERGGLGQQGIHGGQGPWLQQQQGQGQGPQRGVAGAAGRGEGGGGAGLARHGPTAVSVAAAGPGAGGTAVGSKRGAAGDPEAEEWVMEGEEEEQDDATSPPGPGPGPGPSKRPRV